MELEGNSNSGTSAAFLRQLRQRHAGRLNVIWDNAPAHRGEAVREYLRRPGLGLRLLNLPGYSPDFNADEAIWGWARQEATGNLCLGSRAAVQGRSAASSPGWPAGRTRSDGAAVPSCNQEPKVSCETPILIHGTPQMHIPPWLWFMRDLVCYSGFGISFFRGEEWKKQPQAQPKKSPSDGTSSPSPL